MTDWMEPAKCVDLDPDLFFPERGANAQVAAAKDVCRACPVRAECLDYALDIGVQHGIWGGKSERERRSLRRGRGRRLAS